MACDAIVAVSREREETAETVEKKFQRKQRDVPKTDMRFRCCFRSLDLLARNSGTASPYRRAFYFSFRGSLSDEVRRLTCPMPTIVRGEPLGVRGERDTGRPGGSTGESRRVRAWTGARETSTGASRWRVRSVVPRRTRRVPFRGDRHSDRGARRAWTPFDVRHDGSGERLVVFHARYSL